MTEIHKGDAVRMTFEGIVERVEPDGRFAVTSASGGLRYFNPDAGDYEAVVLARADSEHDRYMSCPCGRGDYHLCRKCPYESCSVHGRASGEGEQG